MWCNLVGDIGKWSYHVCYVKVLCYTVLNQDLNSSNCALDIIIDDRGLFLFFYFLMLNGSSIFWLWLLILPFVCTLLVFYLYIVVFGSQLLLDLILVVCLSNVFVEHHCSWWSCFWYDFWRILMHNNFCWIIN